MNPITSFIKRYPLAVFFSLAIATFYAGNLWKVNDPNSPWYLSIYGTGLSALFVVAVTEGRTGVKAWASRIVRWRVGLIWYVVAFSAPLILQLTGYALDIALGTPAPLTSFWSRLSIFPTQFIPIMLVIALGEETGFRGYALPKLLEKHSPLAATLILGTLHAIWHVPLFLTGDSWWVVLHVIGGAFLFTWIFMNTRGSVFLAILLHSANNAWAKVISPSFGGVFADQYTMLVGFAFVAMAAILIFAARPKMSRKLEAGMDMMAAEGLLVAKERITS